MAAITTMWTATLRLRVLCLLGVLLLTLSSSVLAQNRVGRPGLVDPSQANPLLQVQKRVLEGSLENAMIALEGALDPEDYVVGPGDQFGVTTGGLEPIQAIVPVSADGSLVLPEAGSIPAGGRTLAEVQRDALEALRSRFQNVPIEVSLVQPRMFYVHISGSVPEPGRYLMLPIARVDDAIQQAYASRFVAKPDPEADGTPRILTSATSERPMMHNAFRPALRNVRLIRRDGSEVRLDLIRYYTTGDTEHNPYLRDGDVVEVPAYHVERDAVRVSGEVAFPGLFDHRPGDTVLDLLTLAAGPSALPHLSEVRVTRRTTDGTIETILVDVPALLTGEIEPVPVNAGDHLNVLPQETAQAAIQGLVQYPGTYPIQDGRTTLRELIEMAGGLKPDADTRSAFIERRQTLSFKATSNAADLDFFDRVFLQRALNENRVVLNIEEALQPGAPDVVLRDGDRVVFPRAEGTVFVTGNVPRPGYVPYVEGEDAEYYIDRAGGKGPLSTEVIVFEAGTGEVKSGDNAEVRPGDTVFVNRKAVAESPEIAQLLLSERASRRQTRIMTVQTAITSLTAAISIVATLKSFGAFD